MTIREIAKLAGVSISTVSKIVNNKDENINPQTRSRVLQIVKEYNYAPYSAVKNASGARSFILGVLLNTAAGRSSMLGGILQTAQEHGYSILLLSSEGSRETEAKHITVFCKNKVDGVLWEPISEESCRLGKKDFDRQAIPYCLINGFSLTPSFQIDFSGIGYTLTRKLTERNHTGIACLLSGDETRSSQILSGFQKCLYDYQIPYSDRMLLPLEEEKQIRKILRHNITGIVSADYRSACALYRRLLQNNYSIPGDFSLVCPKEEPDPPSALPLSGIQIPYSEFGSFICLSLIQKCEKSSAAPSGGTFSRVWQSDHDRSIDSPPFLRMKRFVVVGSINMDITFNVDRLPQSGKTTNILSSATTTGGKGANQAVGIARLGHEVSLIAEIGNDLDATRVFDVLLSAGVHTQGIHRNKKQETGKAYIYIESGGESAISILSGANGTLTAQNIRDREQLFQNAGFCLISTEIPLEAAVTAAETARAHGAMTFLKPPVLKELPSALIQNTDVFIPNRKEASALCPEHTSIPEQADFFLSLGFPTVIITLGHEGCYLRTSDTAEYFPASDFTATDTTGGADAFISALACYLCDGYTLERAVQIAMYAAGFCISRQGVIPALADKYTLEAYIIKHAPELLKL